MTWAVALRISANNFCFLWRHFCLEVAEIRWTCCNEYALYYKSSIRIFFNDFWAILRSFAILLFFLRISPNFIIHHLIFNFHSNTTFYAVDGLAGGLVIPLDLFHAVVNSFCVNFTLFCHLQVVNFRIFQSWNLITCSFWCHAGFVWNWQREHVWDLLYQVWLDSSDNHLA